MFQFRVCVPRCQPWIGGAPWMKKLSGACVSEQQRELGSPDSCINYRSQAMQTDLLRRQVHSQRERKLKVYFENWTKTLKGSNVCFGYELMVGGQEEKFGLTPINDVLWAQSGAQPWNCRESCTGFATGPGGPGPVTGSSTVSVICACVCERTCWKG